MTTGNSVYNSKRNGGRATVYFEPELKEWLKLHAIEDGRSLSAMVDKICVKYAEENGYEAEVSLQIELAPVVEVIPQTEIAPLKSTLQVNLNNNPSLNNLLKALSSFLEDATRGITNNVKFVTL